MIRNEYNNIDDDKKKKGIQNLFHCHLQQNDTWKSKKQSHLKLCPKNQIF